MSKSSPEPFFVLYQRAASFAARPAKKPAVGFFCGARFVVLASKEVKIAVFSRKTKPSGLAQMRFCI